MVIKREFKILGLLLFGLCLFVSCQREKKGDAKLAEDNKASTGFSDLDETYQELYYRYPAPDEIFRYIDSTGLTYRPGLTHNVSTYKNYLASNTQSIYLGVYIADLAYLTLFRKYKESMDYFEVIYNLSDELRISAAIDQNFRKRVENNLKSIDSLKVISEDAYTHIVNYLAKNNKEKMFAYISVGGFVEALYLVLNLVENFDMDNQTVQRIADQKSAFANLLNYIKAFKDDPAMSDLIVNLNPLQEAFNNITFVKTPTKVVKREDGKIQIKGGIQLNITKEEFNLLRERASEVRAIIIKG